MNIIRVQKNANYVVMNRTALNDKRLSWKAKGILAYMLSMPDDWVFYLDELMTHAPDGKASFRAGFNELKKYGYVERRPIKDGKTHKITHWETIVYEVPKEPLTENPVSGKTSEWESSDMEIHHVENQTLLNTDNNQILKELNTDNKKNMSSKELDSIPYKEIVDYLNQKANTNYRHTTKKTRQLIQARWKEDFRLEDFKKVIDNKTSQWLNDPKMNKYLRPETLFGTKFESYLNERVVTNGRNQQVIGQTRSTVNLGF